MISKKYNAIKSPIPKLLGVVAFLHCNKLVFFDATKVVVCVTITGLSVSEIIFKPPLCITEFFVLYLKKNLPTSQEKQAHIVGVHDITSSVVFVPAPGWMPNHLATYTLRAIWRKS